MKPVKPIYAGRFERLIAYLIDAVALSLPTAILIQILNLEAQSDLLIIFMAGSYFTWFIGSAWQASPGQRLLGMYVIRTNGKPLRHADALERFLAFFLPQLLGYVSFMNSDMAKTLAGLLGLLWILPILFRDERTGIHDQICHTRVVVGRANGS